MRKVVVRDQRFLVTAPDNCNDSHYQMDHCIFDLVRGSEITFWRTVAGAEIDILILKSGNPYIGIEVKSNETNPRPRRGFFVGCDDLSLCGREHR